jgi:hypothetical protein
MAKLFPCGKRFVARKSAAVSSDFAVICPIFVGFRENFPACYNLLHCPNLKQKASFTHSQINDKYNKMI